MLCDHYFYNCSKEYITDIDRELFNEINSAVESMPKLGTQAKLNHYLFKIFTDHGWSYDSIPPGLERPAKINDRGLCLTSSTLQTNWHSDFAKKFGSNLVQIEVQFGKVESMFKDFCGFKIAYFERRIALGIEIVLSQPSEFFAHRKSAVSGMAYFEVAKNTLGAIGLNCPIWLIGIKET